MSATVTANTYRPSAAARMFKNCVQAGSPLVEPAPTEPPKLDSRNECAVAPIGQSETDLAKGSDGHQAVTGANPAKAANSPEPQDSPQSAPPVERRTYPAKSETLSVEAPPARSYGPAALSPGLVADKRTERQFVRVPIPFQVRCSGLIFKGVDLSLDGFAFTGKIPDQHHEVEQDLELQILFRGYALTTSISGTFVRYAERQKISSYRITKIGSDELDMLRRLIRAYLSGQLVTLDGFIINADSQTKRKRTDNSAAPKPKTWREHVVLWRYRLSSLVAATIALMLVLILLAGIIERFAIVDAEFATVTAPRLDLRAPRAGRVSGEVVPAGATVQRDQKLFEIIDQELVSEILLARADLETEAKIAGTHSAPTFFSNRGGGVFSSAGNALGRRVAKPNEASLPRFNGNLKHARMRLAALELLEAETRFHAPCNCTVWWARRFEDWVEPGDTVMTLMERDANKLAIEALVPVHLVARLSVNDRVLVTMPNRKLIEAQIVSIRSDNQVQPTVGFPKALRDDKHFANVRLRSTEPLSADIVGMPLNVRFSSLNTITDLIAFGREGLRTAWSSFARAVWHAPGTLDIKR